MLTSVVRGHGSNTQTSTANLSRLLLLTGILGLACGSLVHADQVIFKDGFTLVGKVKQEKTTIFDPQGGVQLSVPKNIFFFVDDEARRIYFSHRAVQAVDEKKTAAGTDPMALRSSRPRITKFNLPAGQYGDLTPWDAKWDRVLTLNLSGGGKTKIDQHLSILSPYYMRIDARSHEWSPHYLTKELDPDVVRDALVKHAELKLTGGSADIPKRFRIYRFMLQAGWFDRALAELNGILRDFPEQKDKVEAARENLKKLAALQVFDLIEVANKCGRHGAAQTALAKFPVQLLDQSLQARVRALQSNYETSNQNVTLAKRFLEELPAVLLEADQRTAFSASVEAILAELNIDTVPRLETFLSLAQQAERERLQSRTPAYSPEQLLALAITSWLMGNGSYEPRVDYSLRLWRARQFIQKYQKTNSSTLRQSQLAAYERDGGLAFDELAQLIRQLPPPEPLGLAALTLYPLPAGLIPAPQLALISSLALGQKLPAVQYQVLQASLPWSARKGPTFHLQLPPEYHPGRLYPVLIVLHNAFEKPEDMLKRWSLLAAQQGYILVAPEWDRTPAESQGYFYTFEEHRAVLDVLRDLRQHFQVDSDRVFLSGFGEGGTMAFDVGLSHPDQFAGVIPMGGRPRPYANRYWPDAQYLPFYVVDGDLNGDTLKDDRRQFDSWLGHGYYALLVQYRGRGSEWFDAELPMIFDWMNRKKRATPVPELGHVAGFNVAGEEFQCFRPSDNRFYWISGDGLLEKHTNDNARTFDFKKGPATLQAKISSGNQINVNAHGFRQVTIWLGQGMVDFTKPVRVFVNQKLQLANRKLVPNANVVLEDLYLRGDRQRQFWAKIELSP